MAYFTFGMVPRLSLHSAGGNRKGKLKKEGNLLTVFTVSGLWHGASLAFVFWGILNGIYQVIEDAAGGNQRES